MTAALALALGGAVPPTQPARPPVPPPAAVTAPTRKGERLFEAAALLNSTPTGGELVSLFRTHGVRLRFNDGGLFYSDTTNRIHVSDDYLALPDWQLAVMLAHELEHARQRALGLTEDGARAYRELGAFWIQSRVWVELGASVRDADLPRNLRNSMDMRAWLGFPTSVASAIAVRAGLPRPVPAPKLADYWKSVVEGDAAWRGHSAAAAGPTSKDAALFVLRQAARIAELEDGPSPDLPELLERAARLGPGESIAVPALSKADRAFLGAPPLELEASPAGSGWTLRRPR